MKDLDNIEGIGMDKEEKPKRKRVAPKPVVSRKLKATDQHDRILDLYDSGFSINQIGAMLTIHTSYITDLINKENAKL